MQRAAAQGPLVAEPTRTKSSFYKVRTTENTKSKSLWVILWEITNHPAGLKKLHCIITSEYIY